MSRKSLALGITALVLLISLLTQVAAACIETRYHQHLEAEPVADEGSDNGFSSHLPLLLLDTEGVDIPGAPVYDENLSITGYTTAADGSTTISAGLSIIENDGQLNRPEDTPTLQSSMQIRIRGNSSREFAKKSYAIRLENSDGSSNDQALLGMDAHHEWVLYGPYLDKTLIRNYMWYNIAGEIMDYAPNVRFCEVFLNGAYQGLYLLTESITAGEAEGGRLSLSVSKKHSTFSGYLLQLDKGTDTPLKQLNDFLSYSKRISTKVEIVYPGNQNLTAEIQRNIALDISAFEKALYSYDYDNDEYGYKDYIDVESFVDYFLINEVTSNYDAGYLSTYIYKDTDQKYRMCVWDFNNCCDNYKTKMDCEAFEMQYCPFYVMLIKDEDFTNSIISRYRILRKTYLSDEYLMNYIDETVAYLGDAIERNDALWGDIYDSSQDMLQPASRNPRSYEEAIEQLKSYLLQRVQWMDENIETLRQYSAESRVKKFNEVAN